MESKRRRSRRSLIDEELRSNEPRTSIDEQLVQAMTNVSLRNVPLEERKREAGKPLFLTRYE